MFKLKCPNCGKVFECYAGGCGTHVYDYRTTEDSAIYGEVSTGILTCPNCGGEEKESRWTLE